MAFEVAMVCGSVAELVFPGVVVKDLTQARDAIDPRECPVLAPHLDSGFELASLDDMSFGSARAKKDLRYSLTYALYFAPVDTERGLHVITPGLWSAVSDVVTVFRDNDTLTGCQDIRPTRAVPGPVIEDPSGNKFHGALITLTVLEHAD